ncbi:fluoride efflux transporter CrcB [Nodosilinea nodulosa]|uniref:fluoride efflux transporter CrcB n=1 Tax=Nodosilinea nodulosa TaxID=416001 RepID=UPI0004745EA3|nr:fluoride efflux transporter CrcB [Nodosilinea nodulosa]
MVKQPVRTMLAISLGAIAGALGRYYVGIALNGLLGTALPLSTLVINVTGCFGMGLLATLSVGRAISLHPDLRLLLLTGFLGSYTTFSTYELESSSLLAQDRLGAALYYWAGSALLGLIGLQLGIALAEWLLKQLEQN